jgi:hypothetical protein
VCAAASPRKNDDSKGQRLRNAVDENRSCVPACVVSCQDGLLLPQAIAIDKSSESSVGEVYAKAKVKRQNVRAASFSSEFDFERI